MIPILYLCFLIMMPFGSTITQNVVAWSKLRMVVKWPNVVTWSSPPQWQNLCIFCWAGSLETNSASCDVAREILHPIIPNLERDQLLIVCSFKYVQLV
jgi:hypothetical protein